MPPSWLQDDATEQFFQSPDLLSLGCCGLCLSLRLSCCCSACPLPFPFGWGVPLVPCASDRRLAGCISSGLPVAVFCPLPFSCFCVSLPPFVLFLFCLLLLFFSSFRPCVFWWVCVWSPPSPTPSLFAHFSFGGLSLGHCLLVAFN